MTASESTIPPSHGIALPVLLFHWAWLSILTITCACWYLHTLHMTQHHRSEPALPLSREQCAEQYGYRHYLSNPQHPVLLYTFPGSGNTWTRLLLEYATGVYTGSLYDDASLLEALPGEMACNFYVSAIKAHPGMLDISGPNMPSKCAANGVKQFHRAILVYRNPYEAIWSEYQRQVSGSHVGSVNTTQFDVMHWFPVAQLLALDYKIMWEHFYSQFTVNSTENEFIFVKYEFLKNPVSRVPALKTMVEFLNLPSFYTQELESKLQCAFLLSERKEIHRKSQQQSATVTIREAYNATLVCILWEIFGDFMYILDYKPYGGVQCEEHVNKTRTTVLLQDWGKRANGTYVRRSQEPVGTERPPGPFSLRPLTPQTNVTEMPGPQVLAPQTNVTEMPGPQVLQQSALQSETGSPSWHHRSDNNVTTMKRIARANRTQEYRIQANMTVTRRNRTSGAHNRTRSEWRKAHNETTGLMKNGTGASLRHVNRLRKGDLWNNATRLHHPIMV